MAKVITVAQQKGGAGKTSIATHLAIAWAGYGVMPSGRAFRQPANDHPTSPIRKVIVLDMDPQESLTSWFKVRQDRFPDEQNLSVVPASGWRISAELIRAKREADIVVIDTPPHAENSSIRQAIRSADLIVVPTQLSPMDIWACQNTLDLIQREKKNSIIVLNRVPPRARLADELMAQLKADDLPLAKAHVGNRIAFASSMMEGQGVTEAAPSSLAAAEIRLLAGEVLRAA